MRHADADFAGIIDRAVRIRGNVGADLRLAVWGYWQARENIEHARRRREALREV